MGSDADALAIVRATIDLGHVLGLTVVAEGVEDEETRSRLCSLGVDRLQGYAIARPMPASDIASLLDERSRLSVAV